MACMRNTEQPTCKVPAVPINAGKAERKEITRLMWREAHNSSVWTQAWKRLQAMDCVAQETAHGFRYSGERKGQQRAQAQNKWRGIAKTQLIDPECR